jgi:hypothetical protein
MRLHIPEIGTQYRLTADWTFNLYFEYRNRGFGEALGITPPIRTPRYPGDTGPRYAWTQESKFTSVTLPAGTVLQVDRIYIRKGNEEFSSLTFRVVGKRNQRFWAKLSDVNQIECDLLP